MAHTTICSPEPTHMKYIINVLGVKMTYTFVIKINMKTEIGDNNFLQKVKCSFFAYFTSNIKSIAIGGE